MRNLLLLAGMALILAMGASAGTMADDKQPAGKVTVILTHEVKNYDAWRKVYDADEPNRVAGGFTVSGVYRDAKSPNVITIIGEFRDAASVEGFVGNPKLQETMEKAGVLGKPVVRILTKTGA